jgi:hypothetical protein
MINSFKQKITRPKSGDCGTPPRAQPLSFRGKSGSDGFLRSHKPVSQKTAAAFPKRKNRL